MSEYCPFAGRFFFIGENKSLPGRGDRGDSEAIGRSVAVAWFEPCESVGAGGALYVRRVAREQDAMELLLLTLAEVLRAAGHYPTVSVADTARDVELLLEADFMSKSLGRYDSIRETAADGPFVFALESPIDAELRYFDETPLDALTKMALARKLELQQGCDRMQVYNENTKQSILFRLNPGAAAAAPAPPVPAPAGRGKGPGRGRGAAPAPPPPALAVGRGAGGKGRAAAARGGGRGRGRGRGRGM